MNYLAWNRRGLGNSRTVRVLGDLLRSRKPNFVFFSETIAMSNKVEEIRVKYGFSSSFVVDRIGRSGGLAIMWKRSVDYHVVGSSSNYIDVWIAENGTQQWRLTCFYGFPERNRRSDSWNLIRDLATRSNLPWCIFRDFNDMLYDADKMGRVVHPPGLLDGFRAAIEDSELVELELTGGKYTWEKSRGTPDFVRERLDRAFANKQWWNKFPLCKLTMTNVVKSDHDPITLELLSVQIPMKKFRFRFENTWLKEVGFKDEVSKYWLELPAMHLLPKLLSVSTFMAKWGQNFFHKFRDKIKKQKEVVDSLVNCEDVEGIRNYFKERQSLNDLLYQDEAYWRQRAKFFWLEERDNNSRFFHASASLRKKMNHVSFLRKDDGTVVNEHGEMCELVEEYFKGVFASFEEGISPN